MPYILSSYRKDGKAVVNGNTGTVASVGRKYVHITIDGKTRPYLPQDATPVLCSPLAMPALRPVHTWVPPRPQTTHQFAKPAPRTAGNARQRRLQRRNGNGWKVAQ